MSDLKSYTVFRLPLFISITESNFWKPYQGSQGMVSNKDFVAFVFVIRATLGIGSISGAIKTSYSHELEVFYLTKW